MIEPTASRFWQATLQSGLADAQALQSCWDAIPPEKRAPEHIDRRLARQAVQSGVLTLWQAQQLIAGRSGGFKIDRYVLIGLIGQGGMGRVYLARDSRLNRRVAVKILSPERVNNPRAIARFHREALVGAQLQHENLVRIYDEGESTGRCYLVMEYIEGKNIGQMISENGPIPPAVSARLGLQVALGLEHAQRKGLIHRDVNPYNILVTRDGTAKLTDLGLAIDLADQDRVTRDGATVGTFDYVSPEQARHSHSVDTRSDIYSLGCTLYHMLTGRVPFPSASLPEKLFSHQASEPEPVTKLSPDVPEGLAAVVTRMMRKSPEDRYATPLELAQALEPFADVTPGPGPDLGGSSRAGARPETSVTQVSTPPSNNGEVAAPPPVVPAAPPPVAVPAVPTPKPAAAVVAPKAAAPDVLPDVAAAEETFGTPTPDDNDLLGLGIGLDLGPEPPLSRGRPTARPKPPARPRPLPKSAAKAPAVGGPPRPAWVVPVSATAGLLAVVIGGAFAYQSYGPAPAVGLNKGAPAGSGGKGAGKVKTRAHADLVVVAADRTEKDAPDFATAVRMAVGSRGAVVLGNLSPLKVSSARPLVMSGGPLVIRAAEGVTPVLEVEVKGRNPFLSTRTESPLRIEGVTVLAKYVDPGADPAPVIEAGGSVVLDRCSFRLEGRAAGSRAVSTEGGTLTATGCWFENFDRALDVASFKGSVATVRHCMFVRTRADDPDAPAGWALRLRGMPGGAGSSARRLVVDHCTARGHGFLDLNGFSRDLPVDVDLTSCAVLSDALILWGSSQPPSREGLSWSGREDQYDVHGESWVRVPPDAPLPSGPGSLDAWVKAFGAEADPVPPPLKFATDPAFSSERPTPRDFAVVSQGAKTPGADPRHVGPGASRPKPALSKR